MTHHSPAVCGRVVDPGVLADVAVAREEAGGHGARVVPAECRRLLQYVEAAEVGVLR